MTSKQEDERYSTHSSSNVSVALALALALALVGCGNDTHNQTRESAAPTLRDETAELARQQRVANDVKDARVAAWEAHMDAFGDMPGECHQRTRDGDTDEWSYVMGPCRSAENDQMTETMTNRYLLGEVHDVLWNRNEGTFTYPEWDLDVQSVWFPSDDVAVIETCMWYMTEERRSDGTVIDGIALTRTGWHTEQRTEEMWLTGGRWKLAVSQLHHSRHYRDDEGNDYRAHTRDEIGEALDTCPIDDSDDRLTDDEIIAVREDIEADYITALNTMDTSLIEGRMSGLLYDQVADTRSLLDWFWCPEFPAMFREEAPQVLPSYYEDAWLDVYPDTHYDNDTWSHNRLGDYESSPASGYAIPSPGNTVTNSSDHYGNDCRKEIAYSRIPIGDPMSSTSVVDIEDIGWSDTLPVAYLTTCQRMHATNTNNDPTAYDGPSDLAIRSTEALRLEGGSWRLVARWNVTYWADTSECPDEG